MTRTATPKIVPAGEGRSYQILGDRVRCLIDGKTSGGEIAMFHTETDPGFGPPMHIHHREDEMFYVLEGQYEFTVGAGGSGRPVTIGPGGSAFGPRGIPHRFRNPGQTVGRMLVIVTPAGLEHFFDEVDQKIGAREPDMKLLLEMFGRYGLEMVQH